MKSDRNVYLKLGIALISFLLIIVIVFYAMSAIEKYFVKKADAEIISSLPHDNYGYVTVGDTTYQPKTRISTFLMIGVDKERGIEDGTAASTDRMADFLTLFVFDEVSEEITLIHINRDTMMEVPVIGSLGDPAGTKFQQIAWAHSYGSGLNDSCRNTADAVSSLLYGITIENYMSLTMESVPILNDLVGGVEVKITDDFSAVDPSLVQGETVKLMGDQALTFVRARGSVGDETNISRMRRQKEYMASFADAIKVAYSNDKSLMLDISEALEGYMVTDCTIGELNEIAERFSAYELVNVISPEGESKVGEKYMEHTVDEDALTQLVVDVFYKPIE